ncbi:MAG TPA: PKD domain-containing protein [Thermoleophilaceae bacterium]|nr:PKD domain-containing protein [Thermoleophilaceae bacterium]
MDSRAALLLALVAGLCLPAGAQAASVTVQGVDGATRSFPLAELAQDVDRPYTVRTSTGEQSVPVRGTSLNALISEAGADTIGVGSIEISGGGPTVVLTPEQLSGAGSGSPVVFAEGGRAVFLRPAYSGDDLNGDDRISASSLRVRLRKGTVLEVDAKASDKTLKVGQPVTFAATGTGGAGQQLAYNWTFSDGSKRVSGARAVHRFREQGSYDVLVSVRTAEDEAGAFDRLRVRVGGAPKGPDRKGGGTSADASAPDGGTAAGGDSGASGGTGAAASGPAQAPGEESAAPAPSRPSRRPAAPGAGGRQIEGTLLADATVVPPREAARKRAARTGNDRPGDDGGFRVPGVAWGVLITLGLVGTGALIELRTVLPLPGRKAA